MVHNEQTWNDTIFEQCTDYAGMYRTVNIANITTQKNIINQKGFSKKNSGTYCIPNRQNKQSWKSMQKERLAGQTWGG